jgi:WD40 repeat protein
VLRGGTEYAYAALAFSPDGAQLASVGGPSDYLLAVWDWCAGSVLLRCKAFSQEVYSVAFAARTAGRLVTSGLGHIRFWRMASTFTGLKLQVGSVQANMPAGLWGAWRSDMHRAAQQSSRSGSAALSREPSA